MFELFDQIPDESHHDNWWELNLPSINIPPATSPPQSAEPATKKKIKKNHRSMQEL